MTAPLPVSNPFGFGGSRGTPVIVPPSSVGGPPAPMMGWALQLPLPEVYPLPEATSFNPLGSKATAAIETNIAIPGASVVIPSGMRAVVVGVSLYISNMLATTNVSFTVLVNGVAASGYAGIGLFPAAQALAQNSFDVPIRVLGPATVQVVYTNTDGGSYTVGASLSGWYWANTSDQRYKTTGS